MELTSVISEDATGKEKQGSENGAGTDQELKSTGKWFTENSKSIEKLLHLDPKFTTPTIKNWLNKVGKFPTSLFDSHGGERSEFEKILNSSDKKIFLDISIVLALFNIYNDVEFLEEYGKNAVRRFGKFPINLEPNGKPDPDQPNVENLFSYLMYDWFYPEPGQTYAMVMKSEQFNEVHSRDLFKLLFDIVDDQKYKMYRHVVLRLLYQYLYELGKENRLKSDGCFERIDQLKKLLLDVKDQELRTLGIKVVTVFWLISCTNGEKLATFEKFIKNTFKDDQTHNIPHPDKNGQNGSKESHELSRILLETSEFLNLCFHLKNEKVSLTKFQEEFEVYLNHSRNYYGDCMPVAIGHNVQLLSFLARKETLYSTVNGIAEKFPYAHGTTILTVFDNARAMTGFKVHPFKSQQLETLSQQLSKSFNKAKSDKPQSFGKAQMNKLKSFLQNHSEVSQTSSVDELKCFLFRRTLNTEPKEQDESLFEKILKTPASADVIKLVWSNTEALTRSTIIGLKNCSGKYLLEYAIESNDDENLAAFLLPNVEDMSLSVPEVNLQFLNRQYANITGKSFIERFVEICKTSKEKELEKVKEKEDNGVMNVIFENRKDGNSLCTDFHKIVLSLLEDGRLIRDIKHDVPIDKLLEWAHNPEAPTIFGSIKKAGAPVLGKLQDAGMDKLREFANKPEMANDSVFNSVRKMATPITDQLPAGLGDNLLELAKPENVPGSFFGSIVDKFEGSIKRQKSEKAVGENEFEVVREKIDILLGTIVAFWTKEDPHFNDYKKKLLEDGQFKSFFKILLSIIKHDEIEKFSLKFVENFDRIENIFVERYNRTSEDKKTRRYFLWLIVLTAIVNDRKDIIEFILKSERVQNVKLFFPPNMRENETTNYFAMKMLENGYEIGRKEFPLHWITPEQFKNFLSSRMKYVKRDVIEVDCRSLTHFHTPDDPKKQSTEVKLEDTKCLEFILEDHSLKDLITHPTIATYIDLKMHGFRSIYWKNFWFFALLIALPFGVLVTSYFSDSDRQTVVIMSSICAISIIILISRELFQFFVIEDSFRDYIKQSSNILEVCLIFVASATLAVILSGDYMNEHLGRFFGSYVMLVKFLSVTLMLLFTLDLLATLQNAAMPFYFILLRKVAVTFLRFLGTFMVFLIAFTISFVVFFGDDSEKTNTELANDEPITNVTDSGSNEERDEVFLNFVKFPKAFMKIILMLSGEYSIEPFKLTAPELILFFVFVITTFILFNLILGLTMDDVQTLKKEARTIILQQNAESIIETTSFFLKILNKSQAFKLVVWCAEVQAIKSLTHKGDKFYINVSTRKVTFIRDGKQPEVSSSWVQKINDFISSIFVSRTFIIEPENFEEIKQLVPPVGHETANSKANE